MTITFPADRTPLFLPAPQHRCPGRALICALAGLMLLAGGVGMVIAGAVQRGEGGFFTTTVSDFHTPANALVTAEIDVDSLRPADPAFDIGDLGRLRVRATSASAEAIFVGIGPTKEIQDYLRGSAYDEMSSFEVHPLRVHYRRSAGRGGPELPADQPFWVARALGTGTLTLDWNKRGARGPRSS